MRHSFAFKLGILVTLLAMTVSCAALWIFYSFSREAILTEMQGRLKDMTHTGSFLFQAEEREMIVAMKGLLLKNTYPRSQEFLQVPDGETKEALPAAYSKELMESAEFQHLVQILRRIQRGSSEKVGGLRQLQQDVGSGPTPPNIFWAYLMTSVPEVPDHRVVMFLGDSNYQQIDYNSDGRIEGYENGNPVGNLYAGEYDIFGKPYATGEISVSPGWYSDQWGTFMTAVVPIKNVQGEVIATLGVDYLVTRQSERLTQMLYISGAVFAGSVVMAVLFSMLLAWLINRPITRLRRGAEKISQREFRSRIDVRSNDEFGFLADTLNAMTIEIHDYQNGMQALVEERTQALADAKDEILSLYDSLKQENENLGAELDLARSLQTNLLPANADLARITGLELAFTSEPAPLVGGDYFDVMPDNQGGWKIGIGDVSGHGLETGVFMLMMRTVIRTLFTSGLTDLVGCYLQVNQMAHAQSRQSPTRPYMTLSLLEFDGKSAFTITGQHEDILVMRNAQTLELLDTVSLGLPLGLIPDIANCVQTLRVRLSPGQVLILHTNGVTDAMNAEGERFGIDRLSTAAQLAFGQPADMIRERILQTVTAFRGDQALSDDQTLVVIRQKD